MQIYRLAEHTEIARRDARHLYRWFCAHQNHALLMQQCSSRFLEWLLHHNNSEIEGLLKNVASKSFQEPKLAKTKTLRHIYAMWVLNHHCRIQTHRPIHIDKSKYQISVRPHFNFSCKFPAWLSKQTNTQRKKSINNHVIIIQHHHKRFKRNLVENMDQWVFHCLPCHLMPRFFF